MAKLIMWNLMTLDGFVEGENRDISWHFDVWGEELERLSIGQLKSAGGLMFGRVTYELMANHWPGATGEVAGLMNALPKYVFSRTLTRSDWGNTQMFGADVPGTVARLKRESAQDIYLFGSADLAATLMPHRLIDEFRIAVNPVILGGGTPLFKPGDRVKLRTPRFKVVVERHRDSALRTGKITGRMRQCPTAAGAEIIRAIFAAYMSNDRKAVEDALAEDFRFTSPYDDEIDKATYFERCWRNSDWIERHELEKIFVEGDEAFVDL